MARLFDDASTQYLYYGGSIVTAYPCTLAGWVKTDDITAIGTAFAIGSSTATRFLRAIHSASTGKHITYAVKNSSTQIDLDNAATLSADTWYHVAVVSASATSHAVYVDASKNTVATEVTWPDSLDRVSIGRLFRGGSSALYWSGDICEVGLWDVALADADITNLSTNKWAPGKIPTGLVAWWKLLGDDSPEPDEVASYDMILSGSPTKSTHVSGIVYPDAGSTQSPRSMHQFRLRRA